MSEALSTAVVNATNVAMERHKVAKAHGVAVDKPNKRSGQSDSVNDGKAQDRTSLEIQKIRQATCA